MNDRASDFYLQRADVPWLAVVLSKSTNGQHGCFVQGLRLYLDGMTKSLSIQIGDDARSHDAEFSIFDNFRQISGRGMQCWIDWLEIVASDQDLRRATDASKQLILS